MEIKTNHMKISKDYSEFALAGELAIVVGVVADSKAGRGVGKLSSRKRKGFGCTLMGSCWPGESGPTRSRASCVTRDAYLTFLVGPKLEAGTNNGKEADC